MIQKLIYILSVLTSLMQVAFSEETISETVKFDLDVGVGEHEVAGRFELGRFFQGTGSKAPQYQDVVEFYSFTGKKLIAAQLKFKSNELETTLLNKLKAGQQFPVVLKVRCEYVRVGHDGINMSDQLSCMALEYSEVSVNSISSAAEKKLGTNKFHQAFESTFNQDAVVGDVVARLNKVHVRAQPPKGRYQSQISICGIQIFNPSELPVTVSIEKVVIEQGQKKQNCLSIDSQKQWQVSANSWSDGYYEYGETPKVIWKFNPSSSIVEDEPVTVIVTLKLNDELVSIKRNVDLS